MENAAETKLRRKNIRFLLLSYPILLMILIYVDAQFAFVEMN